MHHNGYSWDNSLEFWAGHSTKTKDSEAKNMDNIWSCHFFFLKDLLTASAGDLSFIFCPTSVPGSLIHQVFLFCLVSLFGILFCNFTDFGKFLDISPNKVFLF